MSLYRPRPPQKRCLPPAPPDPLIWKRDVAAAQRSRPVSLEPLWTAFRWLWVAVRLAPWVGVAWVLVWIWRL